MGQGFCRQGYHGFEEVLHGHEVGCSANASMVANAATPTRTTANGPGVFLFIDSYKTRGRTTGIIEKFNLAVASPVTTQYIVTHAEIV